MKHDDLTTIDSKLFTEFCPDDEQWGYIGAGLTGSVTGSVTYNGGFDGGVDGGLDSN